MNPQPDWLKEHQEFQKHSKDCFQTGNPEAALDPLYAAIENVERLIGTKPSKAHQTPEAPLVDEGKSEREELIAQAERCGDWTWKCLLEDIIHDLKKHGMKDVDALVVWRLGTAAWLRAKALGAKFPHDRITPNQKDTP